MVATACPLTRKCKARLFGGVRPEVFAHFQLHPAHFGQKAAGGGTIKRAPGR